MPRSLARRLVSIALPWVSLGLTWSATAAPTSPDLPPTVISADNTHFTWIGRTAPAADHARQLAYPGITLRFRYTGAAPTLIFDAASADCYFNLRINGWPSQIVRLTEGRCRILLPAGPAPATGWDVELVRRTESWQGIATFIGLELGPDTQLIAPGEPTTPPRRLLVIGDSITSGHYIEQMPGTPDPSPRTNNAERTWGWVLAQSLGAEINIVAYGGRGLTRTWDGRTHQSTAPQYFERALPDDETSHWDHAQFQPDAVVVMLGQNDFNLGIVPEAKFVGAYDTFVARIHAVHPQAVIVLVNSPMQGDTPGTEDAAKRTTLLRYAQTVAAHARRTGIQHIATAEVSPQPGTAINAHPVTFQHEQIAAEIAPVVRTLTGW